MAASLQTSNSEAIYRGRLLNTVEVQMQCTTGNIDVSAAPNTGQ